MNAVLAPDSAAPENWASGLESVFDEIQQTAPAMVRLIQDIFSAMAGRHLELALGAVVMSDVPNASERTLPFYMDFSDVLSQPSAKAPKTAGD
jgi:hypothetical protein